MLDKPRGPTSHDVVAIVRRALKTREVGHAGTLDPMATGVLVLAIGEATKLVPYLTSAAKRYEARVLLGTGTDTLDALGKVVEEQEVDPELREALDRWPEGASPRLVSALAAELARTSQDAPIFSAIQQNGERAYARARRGETVTIDARPVRVHELTVTAAAGTPSAWIDVRVQADKGYYVRALGRDLALGLGTVGHLTALRRTDSGGFVDSDAVSLDAPREEIESHLIPLATAARRALPSVSLTEAGVRDARCGKLVRLQDFIGLELATTGEACAWFDGTGELVAIGIVGGVEGEEGGRVLRGFLPQPTCDDQR